MHSYHISKSTPYMYCNECVSHDSFILFNLSLRSSRFFAYSGALSIIFTLSSLCCLRKSKVNSFVDIGCPNLDFHAGFLQLMLTNLSDIGIQCVLFSNQSGKVNAIGIVWMSNNAVASNGCNLSSSNIHSLLYAVIHSIIPLVCLMNGSWMWANVLIFVCSSSSTVIPLSIQPASNREVV